LQNIKNTISKKYSAISSTPVTGHEQQSTSYTLTGHGCNCKYSQLTLLINRATNGFQ